MSSTLFVCTANICRSPMAEGLWLQRGHKASSAGIAARNGDRMHRYGREELKRRGVPAATFDATAFRSRLVTAREIESAGVVLCMESEQRSSVIRLVPSAISKTFTLSEYAAILQEHPGASVGEAHRMRRGIAASDVVDPMGGTPEDFRRCADRLEGLLSVIDSNRRPEAAEPRLL